MKYLIGIFLLFSTFVAKADAWDDLTKEEAEKVVAYLKLNPYIFDYCDCCSDTDLPKDVLLVKVESASIVTCDWKPEAFSVKIETTILGVLTYDNEKIVVSPPGEYEAPTSLYMNYTWVWNTETGGASPVFDVIDYASYGGDHKPCKSYFDFPHPKIVKIVSKDKGYKKWFKKAMKS